MLSSLYIIFFFKKKKSVKNAMLRNNHWVWNGERFTIYAYCSPFVPVVLRPSHDKQLRQKMDEHLLHPRRHDVCLRRSEVNVEHDHCDTYAAK